MQRRDLLGAGMATVMLSASGNTQETGGSVPGRAVVLVHGANHGRLVLGTRCRPAAHARL